MPNGTNFKGEFNTSISFPAEPRSHEVKYDLVSKSGFLMVTTATPSNTDTDETLARMGPNSSVRAEQLRAFIQQHPNPMVIAKAA